MMRKIEEIQKEYGELCVKYGDLMFKIGRFQKEIEAIKLRVPELDLEFNAIMSQENPQDTKTP